MLEPSEKSTFLDRPSRMGNSKMFRDLEYCFCLQNYQPGRILDIGVSQPWFLLELQSRRCTVVTVDIDPSQMQRQAELGIPCVVASIARLPFRARSFGTVLCVSTIEHALGDDDMRGMAEIRRLSMNAILVLPCGEPDNWADRDEERERRYGEHQLQERILPYWEVARHARIAVADPNLRSGWLEEDAYLLVSRFL